MLQSVMVPVDGSAFAEQALPLARALRDAPMRTSTSGAGGISRLLLGSVADKIVRSGDVPVLVCNVRHLSGSGSAVAAAPSGAVVPT